MALRTVNNRIYLGVCAAVQADLIRDALVTGKAQGSLGHVKGSVAKAAFSLKISM
jgi:hypothetical protein